MRRRRGDCCATAGAQFGEQAPLDFGDAFVGGQDFAFVLLELGRGEALGICQGLLALEIGGDQVQIGVGHFDVKAEDLVVANLERGDSGALALALFHGGDDLAAVLAQVAQLVEFGVARRGE